MKPTLSALVRKLLESIRVLPRNAPKVKDPRDQVLVVTDAEAENQAYQEARREHLGG